MDPGVQLLIWIAGIHFIGFVAVAILMLPSLRDEPGGQNPGSDSDDGWGRGPRTPPSPPTPPRGGIPLPDAVQASVRLRGPGRLSELRSGRERRSVPEPARRPARVTHDRRPHVSPRHR
jgi:hypothetical protein